MRAERLDLLQEPDRRSQKLALLRRGQELQVFEVQGAYARVRFLLNEGFPFEGWTLVEGLLASDSDSAPSIGVRDQRFRAGQRERGSRREDRRSFPETLDQLPGFREGRAALDRGAEVRSRRPDTRERNWALSGSLLVGELRESLKSRLPGGQLSNDSFLSYDLVGFGLQIDAHRHEAFRLGRIAGSLRTQYRFLYIDSPLAGSDNFDASRLLGQWHELRLLSKVSTGIGERIPMELFLEAGPRLQYFNVNSLADRDGVTPLFFSHWSYALEANAGFELRLPQQWKWIAFAQIHSLAGFQEFNTGVAADDSLVRTGSPKRSMMQISFGSELEWNLDGVDIPNTSLLLQFHWQNLNRSFDGEGSRAGVSVQGVESSSRLVSLGLGAQYRF